MNAPTRVFGFVLGIAAVFGIALAVGNQVGAVGASAEATAMEHSEAASAAGVPGGLMVSADGYTLVLQQPVAQAGSGQKISFVIDGPDGPVTSYDVEHEKRLHFIAVRRDFTGFQHVHPELAADGTWTTALDLTPGQWRVFADFKPDGADDLTLGSDLAVPGKVTAATDPPATRVSTVDAYSVTLTGDLVSGELSMLELNVIKDGQPVTDLQPHLGAYGHLVALRAGDLAYLHVHPDGVTRPGPDIAFGAEVPSVGSYHLYLDFKHGGVVRTAKFSLDASEHP